MRQNTRSVLFALLLSWSLGAPAGSDGENRTVSEVSIAIDNCYHWVGEAGEGDEGREAQIADESYRFCSTAQREAEAAYKNYPRNPELAARILELIDIQYFTCSADETRNICQTATSSFKAAYSKSDYPDSIFESICPLEASKIYGKQRR